MSSFTSHHDQIGALAAAQSVQRLVDVVGVGDLGAALHGDLAGGGDVAFQGADNQKTHD